MGNQQSSTKPCTGYNIRHDYGYLCQFQPCTITSFTTIKCQSSQMKGSSYRTTILSRIWDARLDTLRQSIKCHSLLQSRMVKNIRVSTNRSMHLATNSGSMVTYMKADIPKWGEVWFNEKAITSIFSYAEMEDRYRISYDPKKKIAFIVHLHNKLFWFERVGMN